MSGFSRRFSISSLVLLVVFAISGTSSHAASDRIVQQKIGYVDLMEIQLKATPVKKLMDDAQRKLSPKMKEAEQAMERQDELQRQAKNPSILSDEKKNQMRQEMSKINEKLTELDFQINRQMSQEVDKTTAQATDMIMKAIRTVAESYGFTLVLTTDSLVYGAQSVNLTPAVIKYLNGELKPAAAAEQPAQGGSAQESRQ